MACTYTLTCTPHEAADRIHDAIECGSLTGELIDRYTISAGERVCMTLTWEKHYYRAGNRLTLTAVIDDLSGVTRVHLIGGGGGEGLFGFDWGASDSFEQSALDALRDVMQP